jgi:DNA repair protein RadC
MQSRSDGRLLQELGGLLGIHRAAFDEVLGVHGIGPAKAAQIKATLELGRRISVVTPDDRPVIHRPGDAANLVLL